MQYLEALRLVHDLVEPDTYLEIGSRHGASLALARCPAIAVDPAFELRVAVGPQVRRFEMTSDDFFVAHDPVRILGAPVDFAFIDGMHLAEFALRDFINLERASHPGGVIAIDDILPADIEQASRERNTRIWTGDVYRVISILREYRPDLDIRVYDVEMKGFCLIANLDPHSTVLPDRLGAIGKALESGRWNCASAQDVREALQPMPVARIEPDLGDLAARRPRPAQAVVDPAAAYLDLLKRSILNTVYLDDELRIIYLRNCIAGEDTYDPGVLHDIRGRRRADYARLHASRQVGKFFNKIRSAAFNHSMMGQARMRNLHECLDLVRDAAIPGDLVECGVWRGGGCIFMNGYVQVHGMAGRRVFVVDSFEGLPVPSLPQDAGIDLSREVHPELAVSLDTVRENFSAHGLLTPNVEFLKGWFKDTLPAAGIERIALLRMDGDLYESTMDILVNLYERVVPGGIVIVDDYHAIAACRQAVSDYFEAKALPEPEMQRIDWTGVWFRKPRAGTPLPVG